jgi:hypothetical protein
LLTIDLTGNISDHMIRYAICRTVAEKNGYQWGINPQTSHDYFGGKEQMYFFHDINYGLPIDTSYGQLPDGIKNVWEEKREIYPEYSYHQFQKNIFDIPDCTKIIIYCGQDARYFEKEKLKKWFEIKQKYIDQTKSLLKIYNIELDENTTILNARGGEYIGVSSLFLPLIYWRRTIEYMKQINSRMKFIMITEDPNFYSSYFDFPVLHFGIHQDYYIVNNAMNLIISNSGFGLMPTYLNNKKQIVVAPKYWARHNLGVWANSNVETFNDDNTWKWLDKEGNIS